MEMRVTARRKKDIHMADQTRHPGTGDDAGTAAESRLTASRPRWKILLGAGIVIALLVLMIALHAAGVVGKGTMG
jgi:hypothetical protein